MNHITPKLAVYDTGSSNFLFVEQLGARSSAFGYGLSKKIFASIQCEVPPCVRATLRFASMTTSATHNNHTSKYGLRI